MNSDEQPDAGQEISNESAARTAEEMLGEDHASRKSDIEQLEHVVGVLIRRTTMLEQSLQRRTATVETSTDGEGRAPMEPAPWVWYEPPELTADPEHNVHAFVSWFNQTYAGSPSGRARRIPSCWEQHPGLAMEVSALAALWHAANRGRGAHPRDATLWHHQWRPGLISRLTDWVRPQCLDGAHRDAGAPPRANRFAPEQHADSSATAHDEHTVDDPTTA